MAKTPGRVKESAAAYYDKRGVLGDLKERPIEFSLTEDVREQILSGGRARRLQNISIKLDPVQIQAMRKIAVMKSTPYQSLIRQWLAERLRQELNLAG